MVSEKYVLKRSLHQNQWWLVSVTTTAMKFSFDVGGTKEFQGKEKFFGEGISNIDLSCQAAVTI